MSDTASLEANRKAPAFITRIKNLSADSVAMAIFYGGITLLPLFFLNIFGSAIEVSKTLFLISFVLLSFLFWLLGRLKDGVFHIPLNPVLLGAIGVVLIFFLSALFSPVIRVSFSGFTYELGTVTSICVLFLSLFLSTLFFTATKTVTR